MSRRETSGKTAFRSSYFSTRLADPFSPGAMLRFPVYGFFLPLPAVLTASAETGIPFSRTPFSRKDRSSCVPFARTTLTISRLFSAVSAGRSTTDSDSVTGSGIRRVSEFPVS